MILVKHFGVGPIIMKAPSHLLPYEIVSLDVQRDLRFPCFQRASIEMVLVCMRLYDSVKILDVDAYLSQSQVELFGC